MGVEWDDQVDEIIGGDAAAGFAYVTPARGCRDRCRWRRSGLRDREAGHGHRDDAPSGLPKKLDRLRRNPARRAVAYHAREHGRQRPARATCSSRALRERRPGARPRVAGVDHPAMGTLSWVLVMVRHRRHPDGHLLLAAARDHGSRFRRVIVYDGTAAPRGASSAKAFPDDPRQPNTPTEARHTPPGRPTAKVSDGPGSTGCHTRCWDGSTTDGLPMVATGHVPRASASRA